MLCRDYSFSRFTKAFEVGFLADKVILDIAKRQNGRTPSSDHESLYQHAIEVCIQRERYEMLPELMRLRDNEGLTNDQLSKVRASFFDLERESLFQLDEFFPGISRPGNSLLSP